MEQATTTGGYRWCDYRSWPDDQRYELVGGRAYAMSLGPAVRHQMVSGDLFGELHQHFSGKPCRPLAAPTDVWLSDDTVVQPDLLVVCDEKQLHDTHVEGPPKLVVEILSPSSVRHDRLLKLNLYARFGVSEYWLVSPDAGLVEVLTLADGAYRIDGVYERGQMVTSPEFPDLAIAVDRIFTFERGADETANEIRETVVPYDAE